MPASILEEAVDASLAAGAKALIAISAGLGEMGDEGRAREQAIVERVRAAGAVLVGPNCLGVYDAGAELELCSEDLVPGSIGLVSQSGNLALEVGLLGAEVGLGFSRFVSLGNQADVEAQELVESFAAHEATRLIAVYLEDFRDGRAFARACAAAGKPVVLLAGGATEAAARAARSHTGALASDLSAIRAAAVAAGIELVSSPKELVDLAQALLALQRPRGRRIALAADGGGHTVVAVGSGRRRRARAALALGGDTRAARRGSPADGDAHEPGRLRRRRRAGHLELRQGRAGAARVGGGRRRPLHRLFRRIRALLRGVQAP